MLPLFVAVASAISREASAFVEKHREWFPPVNGLAGSYDGVGGMMRLTPFGGDKAKVTAALNAMFAEGVIAFYCGHGPYHMRVLPPLGVFREEDWPRVFECIERGLARAASE